MHLFWIIKKNGAIQEKVIKKVGKFLVFLFQNFFFYLKKKKKKKKENQLQMDYVQRSIRTLSIELTFQERSLSNQDG